MADRKPIHTSIEYNSIFLIAARCNAVLQQVPAAQLGFKPC